MTARNPFNQLYVGDSMPAEEFVSLFSTELVRPAMPIFERGNVVLSGVQGTGKSMLFKLLMPEVRLAYAKAGRDFPVPADSSRFIGAGININADRCNQFGRRRPPPGDDQQEQMFADFLNTFICADFIRSVALLHENERTRDDLDLVLTPETGGEVACAASADDSFLGYLDGVQSLEEISDRLHGRLRAYRRYLAGADTVLDPAVAATRTHAGDPIRALVSAFRSRGAVPADVEAYVLIDQYEELATIRTPDGAKADYRGVVNSMVNRRDATLSYRIGTRGYAWRDHLSIHGTDARIEQDRDFKLVDLDAKLKRYEDQSTDMFPGFARNVFERRMAHMELEDGSSPTLRTVLGPSKSIAQKAKELAGRDPAAAIKPEADWPRELVDKLVALASDRPLDAKLAEVWLRQKGVDADPEGASSSWRKERSQLALLKIAGARRQRVMYWGEDDAIALSGGNILTFLSLCQHIWDNALQTKEGQRGEVSLPISQAVQTIGVYQAGRWWLDRIQIEYGRGHDRHAFILKLGELFNITLNSDDRMSYPGHSGFSLTLTDLDDDEFVRDFLVEAVDYGNLTRREHTTRSADRKRRVKFYLNPIYCPIFRLPLGAVKEPMYVGTSTVRAWMAQARVAGAAAVTEELSSESGPKRRRRTGSKDSAAAELPFLPGLEEGA